MVNLMSFILSLIRFFEIVAAHGGGIGVFGGSAEVIDTILPRLPPHHRPWRQPDQISEITNSFSGSFLNTRATSSQKLRCGVVNGTCPAGYCCSIGGFCGKDFHYCSGPACQLSYGDECDGNKAPSGSHTKDIPRPKLGNLTYGGGGIYKCTKKNVVALTFDDGPYIFTTTVLDILAEYNAKATFFITGNNMGKGAMDNESTGYPQIIKRMHKEGHQIASHTWTHQNLSAITQSQRENQMYYNEMALRNVLGFFPTYMRPPYSEVNKETQKMLFDLGYHNILYNINSNDYDNDNPETIQDSKDEINKQFATTNATAGYPANFIEIAHDIHEQTAHNLTRFTLERMKTLGFGTSVTVGECLGDPEENWYRSAPGAPLGAPVSRVLANISPTAIPSSGPSSTVLSKSLAEPTGANRDSRFGIMLAVAGLVARGLY